MLRMVSCAERVVPLASSLPPVTCSAETEITCSRCPLPRANGGWTDDRCCWTLHRRQRRVMTIVPTPHGQLVRCDGEKESSLMAHEVCMCAS
jgi:hypothetical protein